MLMRAAWIFRRISRFSAASSDSWKRSSASPNRPSACASMAARTARSCRCATLSREGLGSRWLTAESVVGGALAARPEELVIHVAVDLGTIIRREAAIGLYQLALPRADGVAPAHGLVLAGEEVLDRCLVDAEHPGQDRQVQ